MMTLFDVIQTCFEYFVFFLAFDLRILYLYIFSNII